MASSKYTGIFYSDFKPDQKSSVRKDSKSYAKVMGKKKKSIKIKKKSPSSGSDLQIGVVNYDK